MRHTKVITVILLVMIFVNALMAMRGGQSVKLLAAQNPAAAPPDFKPRNTAAGRPGSDDGIIAVGSHSHTGPGTYQMIRLMPKISQAMNGN